MGEHRRVLRRIREAGIEAEEGRAGDEAGMAAGQQVARAPGLLAPRPRASRSRASAVAIDRVELAGLVFAAEQLGQRQQDRDWRAAGSSTCRHRRPGTGCRAAISRMVPAPRAADIGPGRDSGHIPAWSAASWRRDGWCRGGHNRRPARRRSARPARPIRANCRGRSPRDASRRRRRAAPGSR